MVRQEYMHEVLEDSEHHHVIVRVNETGIWLDAGMNGVGTMHIPLTDETAQRLAYLLNTAASIVSDNQN
jgi:hypothetical protein